jgi:DNA-binding winged helix-turn-helix (wHTH) protein
MPSAGRELFTFEGFSLDLTRGCLLGPGGEIDLRPKSFELLRYLIENAGRLISKDELVNAVWPNVTVSDDSLTQCVSELRHALNDPDRRIIKTAARRGYLFAAPVSAAPPHSAIERDQEFAARAAEVSASNPAQLPHPATRRLAAILAADVVGYSRLIGADEGGTLRALKAHRDL